VRPRSRPWSASEDATLRRLSAPPKSHLQRRARHCLPWPQLLAALPMRSQSAIRQRLLDLGLRPTSGSRWSDADLRLLAARWSLVGQRTLLRTFPGRSWQAIFERARILGLPSIPQGFETLKSAAIRCGIDGTTARRIIRWSERQAEVISALQLWAHAIASRLGMVNSSGVWDRQTWDCGVVEVREHTTSLSEVRCPRHRWQLVAELALDDALTRWQRWETTARAAHRLGVSVPVATRAAKAWLRDPTRRRHSVLRMPALWWDDALRGVVRRPEGRTIAEHSARLGARRCTLERALRLAGLRGRGSGREADHLDAEVDAAWRAYLARPGVAARRAA